MKYLLSIIITWLTIAGFSQTEIKLEDIESHIGDSVKIQAKIYGGKYLESAKGSPTFLNVGGNYPNAPLTVVIWGDVRTQFKEAPEVDYKGRLMFIVGKITMFKGKPEIVIYKPDQLTEVVGAPIERK